MERKYLKYIFVGLSLICVVSSHAQKVFIDENFQKWQKAGHYSNSKDFEYVTGRQEIICADGISRIFLFTDCIVKPNAKAEGSCSKGAVFINKKSKSNGALELPELPSVQNIEFSRDAKASTWPVLEKWNGTNWEKVDEAKSEQSEGCIVSEFTYTSKMPVKLRIRIDGARSNALYSLKVSGF
ncbi:hypothetical protein [Coprobacter sp.]